jgi:hypothetical protein
VQLYRCACQLAQCIPLVGERKAVLTAQQQSQRREYTDQAVATLQQAIRHGYKDIDQLKKNSDLAVLQASEEFQKLLTDSTARAITTAK